MAKPVRKVKVVKKRPRVAIGKNAGLKPLSKLRRKTQKSSPALSGRIKYFTEAKATGLPVDSAAVLVRGSMPRARGGPKGRPLIAKNQGLSAKKLRITPPQEKLVVEDAKYFTHHEVNERPRLELRDLPAKYDKDRIILQVRDPWWLHTYWEVCQETYDKFKNKLADLFYNAKKVLRVYDVSFINFNGSNAHRFFDIEINHDATNWYIDTGGPGRSWCLDLGLRLIDGRFITILRSNIVTTPLDGPSWVTDEEWMVPDDLFSKLYGTAVGLGGSPVKLKKPWVELQKRQFASGGISSGAISPVRKKEIGKRQFWLVVNTELIVYGATEANAKVTVGARPITLRPDGTFSLRFSLPDGKQVIPVRAVSFDDIDERTITPIVTKETR